VLSEVNESQVGDLIRQGWERFYKTRQRVSMALLIFVVVVGLPIIGVPYVRHRLSTRVMALKMALVGDIKPVTLAVGSNHEPFPTEYQKPIPPPPRPPELGLVQKALEMAHPLPPVSRPPRAIRMAKVVTPPPATDTTTEPAVQTDSQTAQSGEPALKYQSGKAEQDAYDLLLKSNPTVAKMVQGSNPSLKFKSWDAANRGEDTYWVRLKFQSEGNPDEEYIWQVKVQSNEVTPLSYNARSIS